MEKKLFDAIANVNETVAKKELIKATNKVELIDELKTLSNVLFDLDQIEACELAMDLRRILRNSTSFHELETVWIAVTIVEQVIATQEILKELRKAQES